MRRALIATAVVLVFAACSSSDPPPLRFGTPGSDPATPPGSSPPGTDGGTATDGSSPPAPPPVPSGCITDVSPGDHTFTCEGLSVDVSIPDACEQPGCGLITEIHGDTGTGALMDANTNLKALGKQKGYVVVAPTGPPWPGGPGSTWHPENDETVIAIIKDVAAVFRTDPKKNHLTGFSRGGFVAWRLLCSHADFFASVAPGTAGSAPGGTCNGVAEVSCPFDGAGMPSRKIPVLFLIGRTDTPVPYGCTSRIRDQAIAAWGLGAPTTVDGDAQYTHQRWSGGGGLLETFEHSYETVPDGPWADAKGHCFPGSKMDPYAPQYAVPCAPPNAFTWGDEVMKFFEAHPDP
jgi:polyhydroxybutyrate depolymerase